MQSQSRPGLRWSWAIWECPDWRPSSPGFLGKSQTGTRTAVMVHPSVLHVPLKPRLCLQRLNPFPMLSDRPLTQLGHRSPSHSLSQTLVCFYYPPLLDTLISPCLHFDPQPSSRTSVSCTQLLDSISDSCIVVLP